MPLEIGRAVWFSNAENLLGYSATCGSVTKLSSSKISPGFCCVPARLSWRVSRPTGTNLSKLHGLWKARHCLKSLAMDLPLPMEDLAWALLAEWKSRPSQSYRIQRAAQSTSSTVSTHTLAATSALSVTPEVSSDTPDIDNPATPAGIIADSGFTTQPHSSS
ncbi:hypothetical protein OF83DRAFT_596411 [Amylostereum chailletii]|nr:hypothetical protein OF83DRAFT_596411 [Amylostereum chailletii]